MAINPNPRLDNRHTAYIATSGAGKSVALWARSGIHREPKKGKMQRTIVWDNNSDYGDRGFDDISEFIRALAKANESGKGYLLAYQGEADQAVFELLCQAIWAIADGSKLINFVVEEYADVCHSAAGIPKTQPYHQKMWTQGRKYGIRMLITTQRPQLVNKTAIGNVKQIWAAEQDASAAKSVANRIGISSDELMKCPKGHFYHWNDSGVTREHVFTLNGDEFKIH